MEKTIYTAEDIVTGDIQKAGIKVDENLMTTWGIK